MIYKADIHELPLNVFIEVYTNSEHNIEFDLPRIEAETKIVGQYMSIVGGKQIAAEIINANRVLNLMLLVGCMNACENLILLKKWKEVAEILSVLGYNLKEDEEEKIKMRIASIKAKSEYDLSKEKKDDKPKEKVTKESFARERVLIMKYNKMQIDTTVMTAGEYAYLVKETCDEIEMLNRKHNK